MFEKKHSLPLGRFTVLDLTRVRAGPTAVRQLADWGANVIKIESPGYMDTEGGMGGTRHGPDFQNIHRNKRSMTLNLKDPMTMIPLPVETGASFWPVFQDLVRMGPMLGVPGSIRLPREWAA